MATQVLQGWDFTDLSHSMLTSLAACIRFEICYYCRFDLLCYLTFVGFVTYFITPGCRFDLNCYLSFVGFVTYFIVPGSVFRSQFPYLTSDELCLIANELPSRGREGDEAAAL